MNGKKKRHQQILDLIASRPIGSQESLEKALSEVGIATTQSTLSKDTRELGVVKVPEGAGFRYQGPAAGTTPPFREDTLQRELTDFVVELGRAQNILAVKTTTGHAQGVCEAIDRAAWHEVVGTLAGENTIFILCRSDVECRVLQRRILETTGEA